MIFIRALASASNLFTRLIRRGIDPGWAKQQEAAFQAAFGEKPEASVAVDWTLAELERRYRLLKQYILQSRKKLTIQALVVRTHVASGLMCEGTLFLDDMVDSTLLKGLESSLVLDGDQIRIVTVDDEAAFDHLLFLVEAQPGDDRKHGLSEYDAIIHNP